MVCSRTAEKPGSLEWSETKGRKVDDEVGEMAGARLGNICLAARRTLNLNLWLGSSRKLCDLSFKRITLLRGKDRIRETN